jgi:hypothetical protein
MPRYQGIPAVAQPGHGSVCLHTRRSLESGNEPFPFARVRSDVSDREAGVSGRITSFAIQGTSMP